MVWQGYLFRASIMGPSHVAILLDETVRHPGSGLPIVSLVDLSQQKDGTR